MTVILVLLTLVAFLTADYLIQLFRAKKAGEAIRACVSSMVEALRQVPADVQLAVNHMWVKQEKGAVVTIGIDEFVAKFFGAVDRILLPETGAPAGSILLQDGERAIALTVPVQGRVIAVNPAVLRSASAAWSDPYGTGWLMRIQPCSTPSNSKMVSSQPQQWLKDQVSLAREFFLQREGSGNYALMQDGGAIVDGIMKYYEADVWEEFSGKFLAAEAESVNMKAHG